MEATKRHPTDGLENRPLTQCCIMFGVPTLFAGYR
jgi:hypothetical protein